MRAGLARRELRHATVVGPVRAAATAAARARLEHAITTFNAARREPFHLSVSVGSVVFDPTHPRELDALMEEADSNMYQEKRASGLARAAAVAAARTGPTTVA